MQYELHQTFKVCTVSLAVHLNHITTRFWFPQINTQFASVIASKCFNLIWVKDWTSRESESNWIKSVNNFICCNKLCARYMDEDVFDENDFRVEIIVSVISFLSFNRSKTNQFLLTFQMNDFRYIFFAI